MLLIDTREIPADRRIQAVDRALAQVVGAPCTVTDEGPDGAALHARIECWRLGPVTVLSTVASGLRMRRGRHHVRRHGTPGVLLQDTSGHGRFTQHGRRQVLTAGALVLDDLAAPSELVWQGEGAARGVLVEREALGLPDETVRSGGGSLSASPLHDLVRHHLAELAREAGGIADDPGRSAVGAATAGLLRALIASAAGRGDPPDGETATAPRIEDVLHYARAHLTDRDLTPDRIAAAHHVSVRHLYRLCHGAGVSLEQWIIARRLEGASLALAAPPGSARTVASVAAAWGFTDPSHFARRFRAAHGVAPREWQRRHGPVPPDGPGSGPGPGRG